MLKPEYIEKIPDRVVAIMGEIEADMLATVARHLAQYGRITGTAEFLALKQRQYGLIYADLIEIVASKSGLLESEITRAFQQSAITSTEYDKALMTEAGYEATRFAGIATRDAMTRTLTAAITRAVDLQNLTNTQCIQGALTAYTNAVDKAYLSIANGATSYQQAYRQALDELARSNITIAEYTRNGKVYNYSIEANVRRNLTTSVNQICGQLTLAEADALGGCIVETSSHAGARPSHAEWQGRRFWYGKPVKGYDSFIEVCGFGTAGGICGCNCGHSFFVCDPETPISTDRDPAKKHLGVSNNELYEATQKQRYYERAIRQAKKEKQVYEAAGDQQGAKQAATQVRARQQAIRDFLDENPILRRHYDREFVQGQ